MWVDLQLRDWTPREGNENAEMGTVAPIKTSAHPWRAEAEGSRHKPIMSQKAEHCWGLRRIYYDVFLIAHRQTNSCNSTLNIAAITGRCFAVDAEGPRPGITEGAALKAKEGLRLW
jgi:hypothetical protein